VAADKAQQQSGDERCDGDAERGPSHTSPWPARSTAPHFDHVHLLTIERGVVHWPAVCGRNACCRLLVPGIG
jgi:hypothetical protein